MNTEFSIKNNSPCSIGHMLVPGMWKTWQIWQTGLLWTLPQYRWLASSLSIENSTSQKLINYTYLLKDWVTS